MKKIILGLLLALVFASEAHAINVGPISTFQCGAITFTDLTNLKVLSAHVVTASRYTTFRSTASGTTAGYQVVTAFVVKCLCNVNPSPGATGNTSLLYGDTDIGLDSSSAPTTPKYSGNDPAFFSLKTSWGTAGSTMASPITPICSNPFFGVPSGKYISVKVDQIPSSYLAYGYDQ